MAGRSKQRDQSDAGDRCLMAGESVTNDSCPSDSTSICWVGLGEKPQPRRGREYGLDPNLPFSGLVLLEATIACRQSILKRIAKASGLVTKIPKTTAET